MKIFYSLLFLLLALPVFSGKLMVYDQVKIPAEDLTLIQQASTEAVYRITNFFYNKNWPQDKIITIIIEHKEKIEKTKDIIIPDNTAGLAFPKEGLIYLIYPFNNISSYPYNSLYSLVYHEIFHVVIYDYLNGVAIPLWFNEGMAMYLSREFIGDSILPLMYASVFNSLIPLSDLHKSFPEHRKNLAYMESLDAISYIVDIHGETSIQLLLERVRDTRDFDKAFIKTYRKTRIEFYRDWEQQVKKKYNLYTLMVQSKSLWVFFSMLLILFFPIKRWITRRKLQKWEQDEEPNLEIN